MMQVLHLLKKDVNRYRWALLALGLMAVCEVYLYGTTAGLMDTGLNRLLTVITSVVGSLLFFFVIILVVQEETLADPQAYWLGRPLARGAILAEKLLFLVALIGLFTGTQVLVTLLNGGAHLTPFVMLGILPALALWQLQVFLAAQTASLPRYMALAVCLLIGAYGLLFLLLFVIQPTQIFSWEFGLLPQRIPPHWVDLIRNVYWLVVGLAILVYVYQRRRFIRAWAAVVVAAAVSILLTPSDNLFGISRSIFSEDETALSVDHVRLAGTVHQQGQEYVECEIVFKPHDQLVHGDIWIRVQRMSLSADGVSIDLQSANINQRMRRLEGGQSVALAGLIEQSQLDQLTSDQVDLSGFAYIFFSHQHRIGQTALREGDAYRGAGNRLLVESIYRRDNLLRVTLTGVVPELHFVPNQIKADREPFDGRFAFALLDAEQEQHVADFGIEASFNIAPGQRQSARLEVPLPQHVPLDEHLIAIYERQITHQTWYPLMDRKVKLVR